MKLRLIACLAFVTAVLQLNAQCPLKKEAAGLEPEGKANLLLLGVRENIDSKAHPYEEMYFTYLIKYENEKADLIAKIPYLVIPQRQHFYYGTDLYRKYWKVKVDTINREIPEQDTSVQEIEKVDLLFSRSLPDLLDTLQQDKPKGLAEKPKIQSFHKEEYRGTLRIVYVSPGTISLRSSENYYSEGAAHPNNAFEAFSVLFPTYDFFRFQNSIGTLNAPANAPENLRRYRFRSMLDEAKSEKIKKAFYLIYNDDPYEHGVDPFPLHKVKPFPITKVDSKIKTKFPGDWDDISKDQILNRYGKYKNISYFLKHYLGNVHLFVAAEQSAAYAGSGDYAHSYVVDAGPVPDENLSNNALPFQLSMDKKDFLRDEGDDFFVSPTREVLFYYDRDEEKLSTCRSKEKPAQFSLSINGKIVMAEWAVGNYVDQWLKEILH